MKQINETCPECGKPLWRHGGIVMCEAFQHAWTEWETRRTPFEILPPSLVEQLREEAGNRLEMEKE